MKFTHATLLLNETGAEINETNLTAVLEAAGADVSSSRVKAVVASLEGVELDEYAATEPADDADATATREATATPAGTEQDLSSPSDGGDSFDVEVESTAAEDVEEER